MASVRGICKIRNEQHIISDTLDCWAEYCDQGVHCYLDCCTDGTAEICRAHPAVVEVIESTLYDPDRERAEWFNRQAVLSSALRYVTPDCWVVYFDGDEHLEQFDKAWLDDPGIQMAAVGSFDAYITEEDKHLTEWDYRQRRWVGAEYEWAPYFYRCNQPLMFHQPDQRNIHLPRGANVRLEGKLRHWGKGLSVRKWEEKCRYYTYIFGPKYADKWRARSGKAVHTVSDFGNPLVLWEDILSGKEKPVWRREGGVGLVS